MDMFYFILSNPILKTISNQKTIIFNSDRYIIDNKMIDKSLLIFLIVVTAIQCAVDTDRVEHIPGYPASFQQKLYSGYLKTSSSSRQLHYVFLQSSSKADNVPVTLWLNGGPGCSSMIGFLQEIGPYFLEEGIRYKKGDQLSQNPYSWDKESHLLFIESPAGVGYSINTDKTFTYNDHTTSTDNMDALLDFFTKYPEYSNHTLWLTGESYAGKYIPDLAKKIDEYNQKASTKINLKGIMVGNGVMSFQGGLLEENEIQFIVNHDFIDPDLLPYYRSSCLVDPGSAGCRYFKLRYRENVDEINAYNVYSYCFYNDSFAEEREESKKNRGSQASILANLIANKGKYKIEVGFNGPECAYFDGMLDYFTAHASDFHSQVSSWDGPCSETVTGKYSISLKGSMEEYRYLLDRSSKYHIILFNGDWDSVVPFSDTEQNLEKLNLKPTATYTPFFVNDQHAGWSQVYGGLLFFRVKGASHMVPQSKRAEAYHLFKVAVESLSLEQDEQILPEWQQ